MNRSKVTMILMILALLVAPCYAIRPQEVEESLQQLKDHEVTIGWLETVKARTKSCAETSTGSALVWSGSTGVISIGSESKECGCSCRKILDSISAGKSIDALIEQVKEKRDNLKIKERN